MDKLAGYSSSDSEIDKPVIKCSICCTNSYKYKCPKCLILSCSLQCVNKHKDKSGCDGKKPPYEHRPIPIKEMNVEVLRKDM